MDIFHVLVTAHFAGLDVVRLEPLDQFVASAAKDARSGQEQNRGRNEQHDPEAGKDAYHLGPVPEHGNAGVTETAFASSGVIVTKKKVILEIKKKFV